MRGRVPNRKPSVRGRERGVPGDIFQLLYALLRQPGKPGGGRNRRPASKGGTGLYMVIRKLAQNFAGAILNYLCLDASTALQTGEGKPCVTKANPCALRVPQLNLGRAQLGPAFAGGGELSQGFLVLLCVSLRAASAAVRSAARGMALERPSASSRKSRFITAFSDSCSRGRQLWPKEQSSGRRNRSRR